MLSQPYLDNIVRSSRLQIFFKISVAVAALKVCTFVKKTPTQLFSCEYCEKFKNTCFLKNTSCGFFCIVQVIVLCNLGPNRPRQNCVGYFPSKPLLRALGQHCTSSFLVQCALKCIWTTLNRQHSYAILSQHGRCNIV